MKVYLVQTLDIWNNQNLIGLFPNLDDAIDSINGQIFNKEYHIKKGEIAEYPSTFGYCFDTCVRDILCSREDGDKYDELDDEEDLSLQIRGYILDSDDIESCLSELKNKNNK